MKLITVKIIAKSLSSYKVGGYTAELEWNGHTKLLKHVESNIGNDRVFVKAIDDVLSTLKEPVKLTLKIHGTDLRLIAVADYIETLETDHIIVVENYTPSKTEVISFGEVIFPNGKLCTRCNKSLSLDNYTYIQKTSTFMGLCKKCNSSVASKKNTLRDYMNPENMLKYVIFPNMKKSNTQRNTRRPNRKLGFDFNSVDELINHLKEINEWSIFCDLFDVYIKSGRDRHKAPSIDRLNNDIGYCKGNLRVITSIENTRAKLIHSTENTTLTGKLYNKVHYDKRYNGWTAARTYIINDVHHTWKSLYPTKEEAKKASTQVLANILEWNVPLLDEITISDWETLYPEAYQTYKQGRIKQRSKHGHIIKRDDGVYQLKIHTVNDDVVSCVLPTRALAEEYGLKYQLDLAANKKITPILKRDWIELGFTSTVPFKKQHNANGNYTLVYRHDYTTFTAYISDPSWQIKYVNDLIVKDLRTNGKLTVKSIRRLDWISIVNNGTVNIEFTTRPHNNGYTLLCRDAYTTFSAYINEPEWQDGYVRRKIKEDILANGKITIPSIKKLDWNRIISIK